MYIYKSLIVLIFLLFNSQAHSHYFSESFSKWNIKGSDITANFSILELEATRILQVKEYEKMLINNELSEKDIFKIYLHDHVHIYSADIKCKSNNDISELSSDEGYLRYELTFLCPSKENIKIVNDKIKDEDLKILNNLFFSILFPSNKKGIVYFLSKAFFK